MSIESAIEERIREAIARGEFDNLPGRGKRLDLSAYFETPEDLRMAYAMLKSNEFVPEEVELIREVEALKEQLGQSTDEEAKQEISGRIQSKYLTLRLLLDRRRK